MKSELIKKRPDTESSSSSPTSSTEQPPSEFLSLEPYESTCLRSVSSIASVFNEKPLNRINVTGNAIDLQQVFSMQSFFVESLIKVADSLEGFSTLKWHDKLTVLHQAFPKIMILRSAFFFNFEENSFYVRTDRECNNAVMVPLKLFYGPTLDSIIGQHRQLAHLICELVERDTIIRDFLVVLILFQSRGNISCLEFLSYCYTKYSHLFERYLVYKYQCASKGKEQFEKLMQIIDDVGPLKKMVVEIYDKLDFNIESTSWTVNTVNGEND